VKNILKIFIITAGFVLYFNVNTFALWDVVAWGGYVFDVNTKPESSKLDGRQFGVKFHCNTSGYDYDKVSSLIPFIDLGLGAYYQFTKVQSDFNYVLRKNSAGLDGHLSILIPVIRPYVRGTWTFMDKIDDENKSFKSCGLGGGIEYDIYYLNDYTIKLFCEYMYDKSKHDMDIYFHAVHFGLKIHL